MMENENEVIDGEQLRDLAALEAMAGDEPALPGQEPAPAPVAQMPLEQEIAGLLRLMSQTLKPILPTVAEIYTEETCNAVGAAVAPVCQKYGWLQDGIGGKYSAEIMCLAIVGPIGYATVIAAQKDLNVKKPQAQSMLEAAPAPVADYVDPAAKTVTFGAPAPA